MIANELADELAFKHIAGDDNGAFSSKIITMLRQQQTEIEALKSDTIPYKDLHQVVKNVLAQPMRELNDEEIYAEMIKCIDEPEDGHTFRYKDFARAILRKASEK